MKIKIVLLCLLFLLCTGCSTNRSSSDTPIQTAKSITEKQNLDEVKPTSTMSSSNPMDELLKETSDFDAAFIRYNSDVKDNQLLGSYEIIDNQIYYTFSKDDITLTFPNDSSGKYTLKVGEEELVYQWPITYYPGSKAYFTAELKDVTKDGAPDLCVDIYLGSGTGASVSGLYIVDLSTMKDYSFTDTDHYSLKEDDAKKVNDMLISEKSNYKYLNWITENPEHNWSIMHFKVSSSKDIELYLGLFEDYSHIEYLGDICGTYTYEDGAFTLDKVWFEPEYIEIYDGYRPEFEDMAASYVKESITASSYQELPSEEIKRILLSSPFGDGNLTVFIGQDYKIYSGFELNDVFYQMDLLGDPYNFKVPEKENDMDAFIDRIITRSSITEYNNILGKSGLEIILGLKYTDCFTYYYYDKKSKRPKKLIALDTFWEAIDLDSDGDTEFVHIDYHLYNNNEALIKNTPEGIKYLNLYRLNLGYKQMENCFIRGRDNIKFKFDGSKFLELPNQ